MFATAAAAEIEDDDRVCAGGRGIREEVGALGLAGTRVQQRDGGLVRMQHGAGKQLGAQGIHQRLQAHAADADPLGQRRARDRHAAAREDAFLTVQRHMIDILGDQDLRQQGRSRDATVDQGRLHRHGGDRLADPAPGSRHFCGSRIRKSPGFGQAYCGCTSRRTKNSSGLQSSFSLTCSPISVSAVPQLLQVQESGS